MTNRCCHAHSITIVTIERLRRMLKVHQDIIVSNLSILVEETDLQTLVPELLNRNVFNERMIKRILNPSHNIKRQKTDLYVEILKRGPQAFEKLQCALESTRHLNLARILKAMDGQSEGQGQFRRSFSLNSIDSNRSQNSSDNGHESDGPCLSVNRRPSEKKITPETFSQALPAKSTPPSPQSYTSSSEESPEAADLRDFHKLTVRDPSDRVFHFPAYTIEILDENNEMPSNLMTEDYIHYASKKFLPVNVKPAKDWEAPGSGRPRMYKMDSNPRGYALLVNNMVFKNKKDYPYRAGADNDEVRYKQLLEQLHFVVECHQNQTKSEMEQTVKRFSQRPELSNVDVIWVTFMSHGQEGYSSEDSEIIGVDGIGYRTGDIIGSFYNDSCTAAIDKPKLFFFQACRGCLTDPGVSLVNINMSRRITTDGKKVQTPTQVPVKIRRHSDIFIAYPTVGGIRANRDRITGTWFIQTIVDIFSQYACTTHLEDLIKLVDERIKRVNNLHTENFQTVTTATIGWSKHLYFNPGLCRDQTTGATVRIGTSPDSTTPQSDEGMDVVDSSTNSGKNENGTTYSRLKDDKDEDSDHGGKCDCLNVSLCTMS